ncbi:hypothetical protein BU23DRAFT_564028 [Bimuria novae-zelandiae CBS 107.79]|uniref:Uncharacterized protein n=1 Tax=Bimuria novae-zelandiae CBS 107.79 TaxID=1447943 RepID=A0A6A5VU78_9PLEO|nr:hypothetical protein BU23DRAFT_564028 [Bimuria novae-zelandiae CBS 107.79]
MRVPRPTIAALFQHIALPGAKQRKRTTPLASVWKTQRKRLVALADGVGRSPPAEVKCGKPYMMRLTRASQRSSRLSANRKAEANMVNKTRIGGKAGVCVRR